MEKRQKLYWEIEKAWVDDYIDVFIYWPFWITLRHKVMAGYNFELHRAANKGYEMSHPTWFVDGQGKVTN